MVSHPADDERWPPEVTLIMERVGVLLMQLCTVAQGPVCRAIAVQKPSAQAYVLTGRQDAGCGGREDMVSVGTVLPICCSHSKPEPHGNSGGRKETRLRMS